MRVVVVDELDDTILSIKTLILENAMQDKGASTKDGQPCSTRDYTQKGGEERMKLVERDRRGSTHTHTLDSSTHLTPQILALKWRPSYKPAVGVVMVTGLSGMR